MKITIFYIVVFFLFATISTHASAQKTKPSQPTKLSSIPVFRVNPVTDTATKISFKKPASAALLKNVTEKMSSEEIAKLSTRTIFNFTLSPRVPYVAGRGQLGGDRIPYMDLTEDYYLIAPETWFGGFFRLEKNKTYLCNVTVKLVGSGIHKINVRTNSPFSGESLIQNFEFTNNERLNGRITYKQEEIPIVLKTPENAGGLVQVFLRCPDEQSKFQFKKWSIKELNQ